MKRLINSILIILFFSNGSCSKNEPKKLSISEEISPEYILPFQGKDGVAEWWLQIKSKSLNELIEFSLNKSPDIQEVVLRLENAAITAKQAGASKWPTVTASLGASQNYNYSDSKTTSFSEFSRGFLASYELDLFGKIKNKTKMAKEDVQQASFDLITAKMSLVTEIVRHWYAYQNLLKHLGLIEKQIQLQNNILNHHEKSYKIGTGEYELLLNAKNQLLLYEVDKKEMREAIQLEKLLLGRLSATQGFVKEIGYENNLKYLSQPNGGVPADLLKNRPDILKAESSYVKAVLGWKVKRAERLPTIGLSISSSDRTEKIKDLFDNWLVSFAANLTATLFDRGYRKDEVKKAEKAIEGTVQSYKKIYMNAALEVNQLLVKSDWANKLKKDITKQITLQEKIVEKKSREFNSGLQKSYSLYLEEIKLIQLERQFWNNTFYSNELNIDLTSAIGGNWFIIQNEKQQNADSGEE